MILDTEDQRKLLLAIISDYNFKVPGKSLVTVANEVNELVGALTNATLLEKEIYGKAHSQEASEEETEED